MDHYILRDSRTPRYFSSFEDTRMAAKYEDRNLIFSQNGFFESPRKLIRYPSCLEDYNIGTMAADIIARHGPKTESFSFGPWKITSVKGHILKSDQLVRYEKELELPQLPEMVFGDNALRIEHAAGCGVEFNSLDALRKVDAHHDQMKVAAANEWQEARKDCDFIKHVVKPFDWTYTTDYRGTLLSKDAQIQVSQTEERIDVEKLKVREQIMFYDEITLFEDELADHGCACLSVKMRVMQSSFLVLLRFFLRVDNVLIRINDTRLYHEAGKDFMLREYTSKEKKTSELRGVDPSKFTNPNEISDYLDVKLKDYEKLQLPST